MVLVLVVHFRWVFRQLWDKGMIYRGFRVMPYSTGCTTPLANFEASQNYKETISRISISAENLADNFLCKNIHKKLYSKATYKIYSMLKIFRYCWVIRVRDTEKPKHKFDPANPAIFEFRATTTAFFIVE
jgi:leucyl-tRNA synthetase